MKNYECRKCNKVIQENNLPNGGNCPKGGSHSWSDLGRVGDKNYECRKCNAGVMAEGLPNGGTCPNGGSHSWSKL